LQHGGDLPPPPTAARRSQAIRFRRPDGFGFDEFALVYPDHTLLVAIGLDPAGEFVDLIGPDPGK